MYFFWKSMFYIPLLKEFLYILTYTYFSFQNEIQMKISNENICSLLVYVLQLSWSFSKFMFLFIKIRIPTIRKVNSINPFTLVLQRDKEGSSDMILQKKIFWSSWCLTVYTSRSINEILCIKYFSKNYFWYVSIYSNFSYFVIHIHRL